MGRPKKTEKNEVIKASAAIHINGKITLLQRRAWNILLANAYDELPHKGRHNIQIAKLIETLEFDSKNDDYLKEAIKALVHCSVEWNILHKDGETEWGVAALLAEARIKGGICTYEYSSTMREKLYNPRIYARLCLSLQNKFASKYALTLWELCTDYLGAKREYGETSWINIDEFRSLMGVGPDEYRAFRDVNKRIIIQPMAEINDISDFSVTVEYQHKGRKVTALKFKMRRVDMLAEPAKTQASVFPDLDNMPLLVKELTDAGLSTQDALEIWQKGFKFVEALACPAETGADTDAAFLRYVREKIHLLKRRQASGKVDNSTGFLRDSIKKNYKNPEFAQEATRQQAADARQAEKRQAGQKQHLERQVADLQRACDEAIGALYDEIAVSAPDVLEAALPGIWEAQPYLRQFYASERSALDNYRASPALASFINPMLERHAPDRIQAVKAWYAAEMAVIQAHMEALAPPRAAG